MACTRIDMLTANGGTKMLSVVGKLVALVDSSKFMSARGCCSAAPIRRYADYRQNANPQVLQRLKPVA